jgi:tungstate transport system ATP-binding protein
MTASLWAEGLRVVRGGRTLLDIDRLDVERGTVLGVIGPNGAGKTTLLLQLALLQRPTAGQILFDGMPVRGRELALRRRMAVVFQDPLLLDRSVRSNVESGLKLRGVSRDERRRRIERWLHAFGVTHLAERSSRTLSGGEAQRVSLARAFALEPDVLLLDEPFSALDKPTRDALTDDLSQALASTGITAVIVTHDRDEAARLGHRDAVLIGGRIHQIAAPADIFSAPADEATAAFVGVETMVAASVVARTDGLVSLDAAGHTIEAVSGITAGAALICIRPEDVTVSPGGEHAGGSARNKLAGRITRIQVSGADARVEIDCGFPVIARVTRRSIEDLELDVGSRVVASFKATAVHLIPK